MKRSVMVLATVAALAISGDALAQTPSAPSPSPAAAATPERLALARAVFQQVNFGQLMDGVTKMMTAMTHNVTANMPADQKQKATAFQDAMGAEMKQDFIPLMVDQMTEAYARTFTEAELRDILAFYQSPTGQALVAKSPALMRDMGPKIMADMPLLFDGAVKRYCAAVTCTAQERDAFDKRLTAMRAGAAAAL